MIFHSQPQVKYTLGERRTVIQKNNSNNNNNNNNNNNDNDNNSNNNNNNNRQTFFTRRFLFKFMTLYISKINSFLYLKLSKN